MKVRPPIPPPAAEKSFHGKLKKEQWTPLKRSLMTLVDDKRKLPKFKASTSTDLAWKWCLMKLFHGSQDVGRQKQQIEKKQGRVKLTTRIAVVWTSLFCRKRGRQSLKWTSLQGPSDHLLSCRGSKWSVEVFSNWKRSGTLPDMQDRKYYLERYKAKEGPTRITTYHKHIALRVPQKLYEAKTHLSLSLS